MAAIAAVVAGARAGTATAATTTVPASADTYVDAAYPNTNFGTRNDVEVGGTLEQRGYVRFSLAGVSGTITRAVLVLGPETSSSTGFEVHGTSGAWGETTATYANAPAAGALVATSGPTTAYTTVSIDVTSYVVATAPSVNLALVRLLATELEIESRDGGTTSLAPRLVVTTTTTPVPPPAPTITSGPPALSSSATATFAFTDSDSTATFLCKLDSGTYAACTSPSTYGGLADGSHTFSVEATNAGGTSAATSATWTVDTTAPPAPTLTGHPSDPSISTSATFTFTDSEAGVTFVCSLDGAAATVCTSPRTYDNLSTNQHVFTVTARDAAGNLSPATGFSWTVTTPDTTPPPVPTITSGPDNATGSTTATFTFSDSEPGVTFNCSLDLATPFQCTSPQSFSGLTVGNHTFSVSATDSAGNTGGGATYRWAIQTEDLANGSFENGFTGWDNGNSGGATTTILSGGAADGTYYAHVVATSTGGYILNTKPRAVLSTVAGHVYTLRGYVKSTAPGKTVCIAIRSFSTPTATGVNHDACTTTTTSWQRLTVSYTAPADGGQISVWVHQDVSVPGDTFDADGLSLLEGAPPPPSGSDPVIAAAGDVACGPDDPDFNGGAGNPTTQRCFQRATGDLIRALNPTAVLAVGDIQYPCGEAANYAAGYDAAWGSFKGITYPVIGNHDYGITSSGECAQNNGEGYFGYWGARGAGVNGQGYYSFDVGTWHIIALNSECTKVTGGCGAGSPEETWLRNDLATHTNACTLAFWHEPSFSIGQTGRNHSFDVWWQDLYNAHADVILNGHDHTYQRWARQNPSGNNDTVQGIREVVVGTGGEELFSNTVWSSGIVTAKDDTTFGVLALTLHPTSYDAQFLPANAPGNGSFSDSFSTPCT